MQWVLWLTALYCMFLWNHFRSQDSSYLTKEGTFDFTPIDAFPVATDCNCLRLGANSLRGRERSDNFDKSLAARFYSIEIEDPGIDPSANESDDENEEGEHRIS